MNFIQMSKKYSNISFKRNRHCKQFLLNGDNHPLPTERNDIEKSPQVIKF